MLLMHVNDGMTYQQIAHAFRDDAACWCSGIWRGVCGRAGTGRRQGVGCDVGVMWDALPVESLAERILRIWR